MNKTTFLAKYNISEADFKKSTLDWEELMKIFEDYKSQIPKLESSAIYIFNSLMKAPNVHSVRYRIKNSEHVIEKIIRKKIQIPGLQIDMNNYLNELSDLIGVRALHLFKEDWNSIHDLITNTWNLFETPTVYYREGDSTEDKKSFEEKGCEPKKHPFGYRSVHYIIETKPAKTNYFAEIQIRTIFEEAWSEIDHTIRYPYDQDNPIFGQFLMILNRLAGSADEMGTFVQVLKKHLETQESSHKKAIIEKDKLISELERKIKESKLEKSDMEYLTGGLEKLKKFNPHFYTASLGDIKTIKTPNFTEIGEISKIFTINTSTIFADPVKPKINPSPTKNK
jgi:ppGpp synthetase/RelA/SpoT-type nucleotidyltranferase